MSEQLTFFTRRPAWGGAPPGAREPSADPDAARDAASAAIKSDATIHDIVKAAPVGTDSQYKPYSNELCPICGEKMYHSTHCRELQKWVCEYHCNRCRYRFGVKINLCCYSDEEHPLGNLEWMSRGVHMRK